MKVKLELQNERTTFSVFTTDVGNWRKEKLEQWKVVYRGGGLVAPRLVTMTCDRMGRFCNARCSILSHLQGPHIYIWIERELFMPVAQSCLESLAAVNNNNMEPLSLSTCRALSSVWVGAWHKGSKHKGVEASLGKVFLQGKDVLVCFANLSTLNSSSYPETHRNLS